MLWPGLAVTTDLTLGVDRDVLTVPEGAIQHGQDGLFVYVIDDHDRAAVRPVKVSRQNATTAVISEGVQRRRASGDHGTVAVAARRARRHRRGPRELGDVRRRFGSLHPSPCGDDVDHGRHSARRTGRVPQSGCRAPAAGRFSDDFGLRVSAGRFPGDDGRLCRAAARAADRPDSRRVADDVDECARRDRDHRPIRSQPQHRRRRQRHSGGHQRRRRAIAEGPA